MELFSSINVQVKKLGGKKKKSYKMSVGKQIDRNERLIQ